MWRSDLVDLLHASERPEQRISTDADGSVTVSSSDRGGMLLFGGGAPASNGRFIHPITREPINISTLTVDDLKKIFGDIRVFMQERIRDIIDRYFDGEDKAVLIAEIERNVAKGGEIYFVKNMVTLIIGKMGENFDGFDGEVFRACMSHAIVGSIDLYRNLGVFFRLDKRDRLRSFSSNAHVRTVLTMVMDTVLMVELRARIELNKMVSIAHTTVPNFLPVDSVVFQEVLEELLWNAVKYGDSQSSLYWDEEGEAFVVVNDGEGLPEDFDPFTPGLRGDVGDVPGTGYGLYKARQDLEAIGGRLEYISTTGHTEFRMMMPRAELDL